jgi:hypothetical protein
MNASVAVSLRSSQLGSGVGNRTGGVIVRLPTGQPEPGTRLRVVVGDSGEAKTRQAATGGNTLLIWLARLGLARYFACRQHTVNTVESDVIGPPTTLHLLGAPILDVLPVGSLVGNITTTFLAMSYAGRLTIAVQADPAAVPDLDVIVTAMQRDWECLQAVHTAAMAGRDGLP